MVSGGLCSQQSLDACDQSYARISGEEYGKCSIWGSSCVTSALCSLPTSVPVEWINKVNCASTDATDGLKQDGGGWGSSYADASIPAGLSCIEWKASAVGQSMAGFKCGTWSDHDLIYKPAACYFNIYKHQDNTCYYKEQGTNYDMKCNVVVDWSTATLKLCRKADNKFEYYINNDLFHTSSSAASPAESLMFHAGFHDGTSYITDAHATSR